MAERASSHKDYFVITTNVDCQFYKAGFAPERIYAMQGDYGLFQCARPCSDELYNNEEWVTQALAHRPDPFTFVTKTYLVVRIAELT